MHIDPRSSIGGLAAAHPVAIKVFQRHGLDFCCGGEETLDVACVRAGLAPAEVAREIEDAAATAPAPPLDWTRAPTGALIDHILARYHDPLRAEMPRLEALAKKVRAVHGPKDPARFERILEIVRDLGEALDAHMLEEEHGAFPALRHGVVLDDTTRAMLRSDHEEVAAHLRTLTHLTNRFVAPPEACTTWRALWQGLADLDADLREHIHLENNVLLAPRPAAAQ